MLEQLTIYHFNDVYHIGDVDLISRFAYIFNPTKYPKDSARDSLRIFSGDVFSPSTESSVLRGEHMVPLVNELGIDIACYGNHDFDFGEARLKELSDKTDFPWVLSNVVRHSSEFDNKSSGDRLVANAHEFHVREVAGYRIGFFGLAGTDWPSNCQHLPPSDIISPVLVSKRLAKTLRVDKGCDFVIAITHMRLMEDLEVANATAGGASRVDLVLGGHDHEVLCRLAGEENVKPEIIRQGKANHELIVDGQVHPNIEGDVRIVKSGTDWKSYSIIRLEVERKPDKSAIIKNAKVEQWTDITQDPAYHSSSKSTSMSNTLFSIHDRISKTVQRPLFHSSAPLDGRSSVIRRQETNLGNLLADAVRAFYETDIAFVNSGSVRCDRIIEPTANGERSALTVKDMIDILPFDNAFVVKRLRGTQLLTAFENSLSDAHTDGRFLQLSGLRIIASWHRPEGHRLITAHHCPRGSISLQPISAERTYTVAMVSFIAAGFDGYVGLKDAETIVGEEGAMTDTSLLMKILGYANEAENDSGGKRTDGDDTDVAVLRARKEIVSSYHSSDRLPVVGPAIDGRIDFQGDTPRL